MNGMASGHRYYHDEPKVLEKYKLWPHGFCDQIVDPKKGTPLDRFKGSSLAWWLPRPNQ